MEVNFIQRAFTFHMTTARARSRVTDDDQLPISM